MKKAFLIAAGLFNLLIAVVLVKTFLYQPIEGPKVAPVKVGIDAKSLTAEMSAALKYPTISHQAPGQRDDAAFDGFISWLEQTYPLVHKTAKLERISNYSLLYTWQGSDTSLKPLLLTAHYDVVPVDQKTIDKWTHQPFSGDIADGAIWGRGALDDKSAVVALVHASEGLLKKGFQPKRTIMLAFGHDEELGGNEGAGAIAQHLKKQNIQATWSLDEGSFVLRKLLPGIERDMASINLAEKGYLTLELTVRDEGGHSSMPPKETAIGVLAAAIVRLQNTPFPGGLSGVSEQMFDAVGRDLPFSKRMFFANRWLFDGAVTFLLSGAKTSNAMIRTTTAPTMINSGIKDNVLPQVATGVVNFRLHPRDSVEAAIAFVNDTIGDPRVEVSRRAGAFRPASKVSDSTSDGFQTLALVTRQVFGDVLISPGLTVGGTDSAHYAKVSDNSFRFNPMRVEKQDIAVFHGNNEYVSIENMVFAASFYTLLMANAASR